MSDNRQAVTERNDNAIGLSLTHLLLLWHCQEADRRSGGEQEARRVLSVDGEGATQQVVVTLRLAGATQESNEANSRQRLENGKPGPLQARYWSGATPPESGKKIENVVSSWGSLYRSVHQAHHCTILCLLNII